MALAIKARTTEGSKSPAKILVMRAGQLSKTLKVYYAVFGTAQNGRDIKRLTGVINFPKRKAKVTLEIKALKDRLLEPTEDVIISFFPTSQYSVLGNPSVEVEILNRRR